MQLQALLKKIIGLVSCIGKRRCSSNSFRIELRVIDFLKIWEEIIWPPLMHQWGPFYHLAFAANETRRIDTLRYDPDYVDIFKGAIKESFIYILGISNEWDQVREMKPDDEQWQAVYVKIRESFQSVARKIESNMNYHPDLRYQGYGKGNILLETFIDALKRYKPEIIIQHRPIEPFIITAIDHDWGMSPKFQF